MTNPFPFAAGATLTAAQLNEIGSFDTWTPSFLSVTAQPTIGLAAYTEINDIVFWMMYVQFDSGDLPLTGSLACSLPVNNSTAMTYQPFGQCWFRPSGGTIYHGQNIAYNNLIYFYAYGVSTANYATVNNVNNTIPETWTTSGDFWAMGQYRSA